MIDDGQSGRWWLRAAGAVARRPDLWWIAVVQARSLSVRRWWSSWPRVPRPAKAWLAFRMETAYGDPLARPSAEDVVAWLAWSRDIRRSQRTRPPAGRA